MERRQGRILGLDFGSKGIGVAVSDEFGWTAQPVEKIERKSLREDVRCVSELVARYGAVKIVVGLPLRMDGTLGSQARLVISFVEKLKAVLPVPVVMWDERFSTSAVTRVLLEADLSRSKRKRYVDKMAAAFILQGYLNHKDDRRSG
jgi:putative Holliday junction resolvase